MGAWSGSSELGSAGLWKWCKRILVRSHGACKSWKGASEALRSKPAIDSSRRRVFQSCTLSISSPLLMIYANSNSSLNPIKYHSFPLKWAEYQPRFHPPSNRPQYFDHSKSLSWTKVITKLITATLPLVLTPPWDHNQLDYAVEAHQQDNKSHA